MRKNLLIISTIVCMILTLTAASFAAEKTIMLIAKPEQTDLLVEYLQVDDSLELVVVNEGTLFDTGSELFTPEAIQSYDAFIIGELVGGAGFNGAIMMEMDLQEAIAKRVAEGAGLAMIGGWCSYQGGMADWSGQWHGTPIDDALPVAISDDWDTNDDGCNEPRIENGDHPIVAGLDWASVERFGGYNKVTADEDGEVLVSDPAAGLPLITVRGKSVAYAGGLAGGWDSDFITWADFGTMWLQLARYLVD